MSCVMHLHLYRHLRLFKSLYSIFKSASLPALVPLWRPHQHIMTATNAKIRTTSNRRSPCLRDNFSSRLCVYVCGGGVGGNPWDYPYVARGWSSIFDDWNVNWFSWGGGQLTYMCPDDHYLHQQATPVHKWTSYWIFYLPSCACFTFLSVPTRRWKRASISRPLTICSTTEPA